MLWRILAASLLVACVTCATHWRITDSGRIESNDDSAFSLLRPYDLAAFIKQVERQERLDVLKGILDSKDTLKKRDSYKGRIRLVPVVTGTIKVIFLSSEICFQNLRYANFSCWLPGEFL